MSAVLCDELVFCLQGSVGVDPWYRLSGNENVCLRLYSSLVVVEGWVEIRGRGCRISQMFVIAQSSVWARAVEQFGCLFSGKGSVIGLRAAAGL
jgi:hypothetical protein